MRYDQYEDSDDPAVQPDLTIEVGDESVQCAVPVISAEEVRDLMFLKGPSVKCWEQWNALQRGELAFIEATRKFNWFPFGAS